MATLLLPLGALKHARRNVRRWMRPQRRRPELGLGWLGAKAILRYQPLGSIGIMVPWNFPLAIGLSPLAEALAAGNRAMLKLSEFTPATAQLVIELLAARFDESEVAAFVGDADVGAAFAAMPVRSSRVHRQPARGEARDARRRRQSHTGNTRARRQVADDRRPRRGSRARRGAHLGRQGHQRGPGVHRA